MSRQDVRTAKELRALTARVAKIERALGPKLDEVIAEMDAEVAHKAALAEHIDKFHAQEQRCVRAKQAVDETGEAADLAAKEAKGAKPLVRKYKEEGKDKTETEAKKDFDARKALLVRDAEEKAHTAEQAAGHFEAMGKRLKELEKSEPKLDDFLPKAEKAGKKAASEQ